MLASPYLKLPEAAAYARVSVRTLQRYLKDGSLKRYGLKQRVLISQAELESLLGTCKETIEK